MNHNASLSQQIATLLQAPLQLDNHLINKTSLCLKDFLGSALQSQHLPWSQQAITVARNNSGPQDAAQLIGTPFKCSVMDAAFTNSVMGHGLIRDDMHVGSVSHLSVVVIPAALALSSIYPVTGAEFLGAIVTGYEAGAWLGMQLIDAEVAKTFRPTGMIGAFAAASAAASIAKLNSEQFSHALGFAINSAAGLNEWANSGSSEVYFQPGFAARNGILAMQLAQQGAMAAPHNLEGKAGIFKAFSRNITDQVMLPFAEEAQIHQVFFKQVPACNYAQTAAQAAMQLKQQVSINSTNIHSIKISVPYAAAHYPGCNQQNEFTSILQAKMSIYYNVASALVYGDYAEQNYAALDNPEVNRLIKASTLHISEELNAAYPAQQGARIEISLADQPQPLVLTLADLSPASDAEVSIRFSAAAEEIFSTGQGQQLTNCIAALPGSNDVHELLGLLSC